MSNATDIRALLVAAGLPVKSVNDAGVITYNAGVDLTPTQRAKETDILEEYYFPSAYTLRKIHETRKNAAYSEGELATLIKTMTPQEAVDWIEANVNGTADVKDYLQELTRMTLGLRDEIWSSMADE